MKLMRYFYVTLLLAVCAGIVSCSEEEYHSPLIGQTVEDVVFSSGQSSTQVSIGEGELSGLEVTTSESSWCNAYAKTSSIYVSVRENEGYDSRTALVTVSDPRDGSELSFYVKQNQKSALFTDGVVHEVPEEGGTVKIEVQSNVDYEVEIPSTADWITLVATRGLSESNVVLKVARNNSHNQREAVIRIVDKVSGAAGTAIIRQLLTPFFTVDMESVTYDEFGGEFEVTVSSNVVITTYAPDNWVTPDPQNYIDENTFTQKVKVSAMGDKEYNRTAKVYFQNSQWGLSGSVAIAQNRGLYIADKDIALVADETYALHVTNNTGSAPEFTSSNTRVATVNSEGVITAIGKGKATIRVTTPTGKSSHAVDVDVINDLTDQFSYTWTNDSTLDEEYDVMRYSFDCILTNNSRYDVKLTGCYMYVDGEMRNFTEDSSLLGDALKPGYSKGMRLSGMLEANEVIFEWEYTIKGVSSRKRLFRCRFK